jgi:hypothetical protein
MKGCRREFTDVRMDRETHGCGSYKVVAAFVEEESCRVKTPLNVIKKMSPFSCPCCGLLFINDVKSLLISRENDEKYIVLISILK